MAARARLQQVSADPLLRSAYSLMLNVVVNGLLGVGFWVVAARLFPASQVGRDSALISAMITLSSVCQLNLHNAIPRFLPQLREPRRALASAYVLSGVVAAVLGTVFVLVVPALSDEFDFVQDDGFLAVGFVVATVLWGVFALQDAALTAFRRAPWVPAENAAFGIIKLGLLPLMVGLGLIHGPFTAWTLTMAVLLVPVNYLLFGPVARRHQATRAAQATRTFERRGIVRFMATDYVGSIFAQGALTLIPILVAAKLGAASNAHFYMAFTIVTSFDLLFVNVAMSLTVEGAMDESRAREHARRTARRFAPMLVGGVLLLVAAAPLALMPFGADYVDEGTSVLRLLALASLFRGLQAMFGAIARIQRNGGWLLTMHGSLFALIVGLTLALAPEMGLTGVGLAWLISAAIVSLFTIPRIVSFLR